MQEKHKRTLMFILTRGTVLALSKTLADRIITVPEEPGIMDDIEEAALKALFTMIAASLASILIRDLTR